MAVASIDALEASLEVSGFAGPWRDAWRRFRRNRAAVLGVWTVGCLLLLALAAPVLSAVGLIAPPNRLELSVANAGPGLHHLLGTDRFGRDLLSRVIHGGRVSLSIGFVLQFVLLGVGGAVGLAAGYFGRWADTLLMRMTDVMFAFPAMLFILFMVSVLGSGYWNMVLAMGLIGWPGVARLVRGQVLSVKENQYVEAALAAGGRPWRVILRHVVPNCLAPITVTVAFGIPTAIFIEAFLSFIGVGMSPPTPSWGVMINEGFQSILAYPHEVLAPSIAVSLTTLAFNFIGDGLRDALDPHTRR